MSPAGTARFCHLCGQSLRGQVYRYAHGLIVCSTCQVTRPRCARCYVPLADFEQLPAGAAPAGAPLCRTCRRALPRCACCQKPILHSWYMFDELVPPTAVRRFCEACVKGRPRCDICRAPVPVDMPVLPDGQFRCALCHSEMVLGERGVQAVYDQARTLAGREVGVWPQQQPSLRTVGRREMGAVRNRFASDIPDGAGGHHVLGFFVREGGAATIYVEVGLPRPLLLGTLSHELAHAWQVEVAPGVKDPLLREGFAEWVAYCALMAAGHTQIAERARMRDDVYGRGLRHFLTVERAGGRRAALEAARGHRPPRAPVTAPRAGDRPAPG
jgi:hypothetical protein